MGPSEDMTQNESEEYRIAKQKYEESKSQFENCLKENLLKQQRIRLYY